MLIHSFCVVVQGSVHNPVVTVAMAAGKDLPDFSDWMAGLDERLHSVPLNSLSIPGQ